MALGNTTLPAAAVVAGAPAAGAAPAAPSAGDAAASAPHSALRKSFHFWPLSEPASFAALYLALHSLMVRACAGLVAASPNEMAQTATAAEDRLHHGLVS